MNNPFDKIATTSSPLLSEGFRESLETRLQPVLKRRRQQRQFHLTLICGSAAVIVLGLCLGLSQIGTFSPRQGPDKSPVPAVSSLSLDQLLEKHFNSPQTDASVTQALGKALAALPYERLLEIMQEYGPASGQSNTLQGDFSVKASEKSPPNLAEVVENNDWMVHVIINQVTLNTEELLDMILRKDLTYNRIHDASLGRVRLDLDLQVLDAAPDLPAENAEQLTFWCFVPYEQHELWQAGREIIIPLCHQWGRYRLGSDRSRQMYWVKLNEHQEKTVTIDHCEFPLDQAWDLIQDQVFIAKANHEPTAEEVAHWHLRLTRGDLVISGQAMQYFKRRSTLADPAWVMDTIERHYKALRSRVTDIRYLPDDSGKTNTFILEAVDLLAQIADHTTVDRMLALYEADLSEYRSLFHQSGNWSSQITRLALAVPGPQRRDLFCELYDGQTPATQFELPNGKRKKISRPFLKRHDQAIQALGEIKGQDLDQLLLEMLRDPASWNLTNDPLHMETPWCTAVAKGLTEAATFLQDFLQDPDPARLGFHAKHKTQLVQYATRALSAAKGKPVLNQTRLESLEAAVARYERSAQTGDAVTDLISTFETHLQPTDIQFLPVLQEVIGKDWHGRGWRTPNLIADTMPDPSLIPALQKAVYDPNNWYLKRVNAYLLRALFACGATEEAITIALQTLTAPVHESDAEAFDHDMYRRKPLMLFLGETGDTSLLDIVETYTREETIQPLRDISRRMQRAYEFRINAIQRNAVLALARLGGEATIPRLQELYQHHDVFVRIIAAFSLHALGDDTAYDLIQHFAEATERALSEVEKRWFYDMSDGVFTEPLRYLHSPRTDALLKTRQDSLKTQTRD
jgi:hypothetical protein